MSVDSPRTGMANDDRIDLLARVARTPARAEGDTDASIPEGSILALASAAYGAKPQEDATVPTGFDPMAVALFECIVEAAYLVAAADGVVDAQERQAFERVVTAACGGTVAPKHIGELVTELADQLSEDGMDTRILRVGKTVVRKSHAHEVLRIAALIAEANGHVSDVERDVLGRIAESMGLSRGDVEGALTDARAALGAP